MIEMRCDVSNVIIERLFELKKIGKIMVAS